MSLLTRLRSPKPAQQRSLSYSDTLKFLGEHYALGNMLYQRQPGIEFSDDLQGYVDAMKASGPAFGAQIVRSLLLSQTRFLFRDRDRKALPWHPTLRLLERPWPKGSSSEMLTKMEWHAGAAGNAFVYRKPGAERLRLLRPDWVALMFGSELDPREADWQLDADLLGYIYQPGGFGRRAGDQVHLLPEHVAHWAPLPDPTATERGMSWLTPVIREVCGDVEATKHKTMFFRNGATPNVVVTGVPAKDPTSFEKWVETFEAGHKGTENAYKTLYFTAGADVSVIGAKLGELDYKAIQGASETRISVASRVPAAVLGISEGLAGSALNAGNYTAARRNLADGWLYPTLGSLAAALEQVITPPQDDGELWWDASQVPFVREDATDAAKIEQIKAISLRQLVEAGFDPESAVATVWPDAPLNHTGNVSVQLQPVGTPPIEPTPDEDPDDDDEEGDDE